MKFLCDVHIAYKIVYYLRSLGFETVHVNDILQKSQTKDSEICKYADLYNFIVITKDSDFRNSFFIKQTPKKLIKISLGNISNQKLIEILAESITKIQILDSKPNFMLEVDHDSLEFLEYE